MKRVYSLMRNNIPSGPYTIDELLQQSLRPTDMIWIDGVSHAWAYVRELTISLQQEEEEAERTGKAATPVSTSRSTRTARELEARAEALRRKALAYVPPPMAKKQIFKNEEAPAGAGQVHLPQEEAIEFVYHNDRRRPLPVGEVLIAAMMGGLLFLGWQHGGRELFSIRSTPAITASAQMNSSGQYAAGAGAPETITPAPQAAITDSSASVNASYTVPATQVGITPRTGAQPNVIKADSGNINEAVSDPNAVSLSNTNDIKPEKQDAAKTEVPKQPVEKPKETAATTDKEKEKDSLTNEVKDKEATASKTEIQGPAGDTVVEEKKKKLGQVIKGLFKKKKKDEGEN